MVVTDRALVLRLSSAWRMPRLEALHAADPIHWKQLGGLMLGRFSREKAVGNGGRPWGVFFTARREFLRRGDPFYEA